MRFGSRSLAAAAAPMFLPLPLAAGVPECAAWQDVIETGDYFLEIESAAGAVGDVVGVSVYLHSRVGDTGWIALHLALCHDPAVAEPVGSPRWTEELLSAALTLDHFLVDEALSSLSIPHVGHGSIIDINFLEAAYDTRFPSDEPMQLFTGTIASRASRARWAP